MKGDMPGASACTVPTTLQPHETPAWSLNTPGSLSPLHLPFPPPGLLFPSFIPRSTQIPPPQGGVSGFPMHRPGTLLNAFTAFVSTCPYLVSCLLSVSPTRMSGLHGQGLVPLLFIVVSLAPGTEIGT